MNELPTFLRIPDPPYSRFEPYGINGKMNRQALIELWTKTGVIQRYKAPPRQLSWSDLWGLLAIVASLAFSFGYFMR